MTNTPNNTLLPVISTLGANATPVSGIGPTIKGPKLPVNKPVVLKLWNDVEVNVVREGQERKSKKTLRTFSRVMLLGATIGDGPLLSVVPSYKCQNPAGVVTGDEPWSLKLRFKLEDGSELEMPVLSSPGGNGGGALHLAATGNARKRVTFGEMLPADLDAWSNSMKALAEASEAAQIEAAEAQHDAEIGAAEAASDTLTSQLLEQVVPVEVTEYVDHAGGSLDNTLTVAPATLFTTTKHKRR